jgi:hypothetical protein
MSTDDHRIAQAIGVSSIEKNNPHFDEGTEGIFLGNRSRRGSNSREKSLVRTPIGDCTQGLEGRSESAKPSREE